MIPSFQKSERKRRQKKKPGGFTKGKGISFSKLPWLYLESEDKALV
jgi:hypothetical protein